MVSGLTGLDHVGVTVRNLDRSLAFYEQIMGILPECTLESTGPDMARGVGIPNAAARIAMLKVGSTRIELLEYTHPRGKDLDGHNNDVGSPHVCFQVTDIAMAYSELRAKGARFTSAPLRINGGPLDGCSWCYFVDPDGVTLEFFERPDSGVPAA